MAAPEPPVATRREAERLVADVAARTSALVEALDRESALIAAGRIRDGLADDGRKADLAADYLVGLQAAKANIVALRRLAPETLPALRAGQERMREAASRNQTVLATAKAVSESLVKSLAEEVERERRPGAYAPAARATRPSMTGPVVFSGRF